MRRQRQRKTGRQRAAAFLAAACVLTCMPVSGICAKAETGKTAKSGQAASETIESQGQSQTQDQSQTQAQSQEQIRIGNVEEFLAFSKSCVSESYSKGKVVVLEADLDFSQTEFVPVPIFAGTFDGGNHRISGIHIETAGSNLGVFRYLEDGGTIKNLHVSGTFLPQGSRSNIGGIAGTNRGRIENCSFRGEIMAEEALGGIAGYNEETGVIRDCKNRAALIGNVKTGGIAGWNEGQIENCTNEGTVNTSQQGVVKEEEELSMGTVDVRESVKAEKVNDAGGIAGFSLGKITGCTNYGAVGYPHTGYNLGGIVGRQSGLVYQCFNYGNVQGRKDVGGIAGQFEPYLTVFYEEDTLQKLEKQMDTLSDLGDSLSKMLEDTGDRTSDNLEQVGNRMDSVKDVGKFYKDVYKEEADQLNNNIDDSTDRIERILDNMELNLVSRSSKEKLADIRKTLIRQQALERELAEQPEDFEDFDDLKDWLQDRYEIVEEMYEGVESIRENSRALLIGGTEDAVEEIEAFRDDLESLQMEVEDLADVLKTHRDLVKTDIENMDEELTRELDGLSADVDTVSDDLKASKDQIREQKRQMEDQIEQMRDTLSDGVDQAKEKTDESFFEDISDLGDESLSDGLIRECENQGVIASDYQAGGIVGIIGMEVSLDPEQDLEPDEERTLNVIRNAKAIVQNCLNRGEISVRNDYVGGIAGKANMGALLWNQNYGDVAAEDGNYAGGITGSSDYVLKRNYSMCSIKGNDYIGGIAGWAKEIQNNYAMVSFENTEGEWIGSIVGNVDEEGSLSANLYVEDGIGAVDGITREGQATGVSYEEFVNIEGVPEEFRRLTVKFIVEDQTVKIITCEYGSAVNDSEIPLLPQKDGYYYEWEEKDLSCVKGNEKIHAIYKPWNTTIASSADKMPLLLAEANFYPETTLLAEEITDRVTGAQANGESGSGTDGRWADSEWTLPEGYQIDRAYTCSIQQMEGTDLPSSIKFHVRTEGNVKEALVGVIESDGIKVVESTIDGSYLVFEMGQAGEFVILKPQKNFRLWLILGAVCALLLVGGAVLLRKRKKKTLVRPEEKTAEETSIEPEREETIEEETVEEEMAEPEREGTAEKEITEIEREGTTEEKITGEKN